MNRFFAFVLFNVLVTALMSGTLVNIFSYSDNVLANPTRVAQILGTAIPQQAFFFTFYMIEAGLGVVALTLLHVPEALKGLWKRSRAKNARDYRDAFRPKPYEYGPSLATHMLFVVINLLFGFITPLILPFALVYFFAAHLFSKYNLLYVFIPKALGSGFFFESLFKRTYIGIGCVQLGLMAVLATKKAPAPATVVFLLFPISYLMYKYTSKAFRQHSRYLNVMEGTRMLEDPESGQEGWEFKKSYKNPMLEDTIVTQSIIRCLAGTEAAIVDNGAIKHGKYNVGKPNMALSPRKRKKRSGSSDDGDPDDDAILSRRKSVSRTDKHKARSIHEKKKKVKRESSDGSDSPVDRPHRG